MGLTLETNSEFLRLKERVNFVYEKLEQMKGDGLVEFHGPVQAPRALARKDTNPTDDREYVTWGAAQRLLSPGAQRAAFVNRTWNGQPVQPLPAPDIPTAGGGTIIEAADYAVNGVLDHQAIIRAIAALPAEGGSVHMKAASWAINGSIEIEKASVILYGDGDGTKWNVNTGLTKVLWVKAKNVSLQNFLIDGQWTQTAKLAHDVPGDIGDPMNTKLTDGTSVWVDPGADGFTAWQLGIMRTRGYAVLFDATHTANIENVLLEQVYIRDNVQYTFVQTLAEKNNAGNPGYGSWTGSVHWQAGGGYRCKNLSIRNCKAERVYGHGFWGHGYTTTDLHEDIETTGIVIDYCGLDGILHQVSEQVICANNKISHVGYINGEPRQHVNFIPCGVDTGGYVRSAKYIGNDVRYVNGTGFDLDGLAESIVSSNTIFNPEPSAAEYTSEKVDDFGYTKGIQSNNSYDSRGARALTIYGNDISGMNISAIILFNAEDCGVFANRILHPTTATGVPIRMERSNSMTSWPVPGPGINRYNVINGNMIRYDGLNFCIWEDDNITGPNYIFGNRVIGTNYGEFKRANAASQSTSSMVLPTNDSTAVTRSQTIIQREGFGAAAATKFYSDTGTAKQVTSIADDAVVNASENGTAGTGAYSTGNRISIGQKDSMATGSLWLDDTTGVTGAISPVAGKGILRYNGTLHRFEASVNGAAFSPFGTSSAGGASSYVQFNDSGALGGVAEFQWQNTPGSKFLAVYNAHAHLTGLNIMTYSGAGGYIKFHPTSAFPTAVQGDPEAFDLLPLIYGRLESSIRTLNLFVPQGVLNFDALSTDVNGLAFKIGRRSNMSAGSTRAIDIISDATYSDWGMRICRFAGDPNSEARIVNAGSGMLRLWSDLGTIVLAQGNTAGEPISRLSVNNTKVQVSKVDGTSAVELDYNGNVSAIGTIAANGATGSFNVPTNMTYNSIQTVGGMYCRQFTMKSAEAGSPAITPTANRGIIKYASNKFQVSQNGGGWVDLLGGGSASADVVLSGFTTTLTTAAQVLATRSMSAGTWLVIGALNVAINAGDSNSFFGELYVDGFLQSGKSFISATNASVAQVMTGVSMWVVTIALDGTFISLTGRRGTGSGASYATADTAMAVIGPF